MDYNKKIVVAWGIIKYAILIIFTIYVSEMLPVSKAIQIILAMIFVFIYIFIDKSILKYSNKHEQK